MHTADAQDDGGLHRLQIHSIISVALSAADGNWCIGDFVINLAAGAYRGSSGPTAAEGALDHAYMSSGWFTPDRETAPVTGAVGLRLLT